MNGLALQVQQVLERPARGRSLCLPGQARRPDKDPLALRHRHVALRQEAGVRPVHLADAGPGSGVDLRGPTRLHAGWHRLAEPSAHLAAAGRGLNRPAAAEKILSLLHSVASGAIGIVLETGGDDRFHPRSGRHRRTPRRAAGRAGSPTPCRAACLRGGGDDRSPQAADRQDATRGVWRLVRAWAQAAGPARAATGGDRGRGGRGRGGDRGQHAARRHQAAADTRQAGAGSVSGAR